MAALSTVVAVAGLGLAAGSTYLQHQAAKDQEEALDDQAAAARKQAEEQKKQAEIAQRRADLQHAQEVRASMRQARIQRAAIVNQGANSGTSNSSGVIGGAGSVLSQYNANIAFSNRMGGLNDQFTASTMRGYDASMDSAAASAAYGQAQGDAATAGALGSLGGTVFNAAGGFKTIFKS